MYTITQVVNCLLAVSFGIPLTAMRQSLSTEERIQYFNE